MDEKLKEKLKEILEGKYGKTIISLVTIIILISLTVWFLYELAQSIAFYINNVPVFSETMDKFKKSIFTHLPTAYVAQYLLKAAFPLSILISIIFVAKSYKNYKLNNRMLFLSVFSWFVCGMLVIIATFSGM